MSQIQRLFPATPLLALAGNRPGSGADPGPATGAGTTAASHPRGLLCSFGVSTARGRVTVLALFHFHPNRAKGLMWGPRLFPRLLLRETLEWSLLLLTRVLGMGNTKHDTFSCGEFPDRAYVPAGEVLWPMHTVWLVNKNRSRRRGAAGNRHIHRSPPHPTHAARDRTLPPQRQQQVSVGGWGNETNIFVFLNHIEELESMKRVGAPVPPRLAF